MLPPIPRLARDILTVRNASGAVSSFDVTGDPHRRSILEQRIARGELERWHEDGAE